MSSAKQVDYSSQKMSKMQKVVYGDAKGGDELEG